MVRQSERRRHARVGVGDIELDHIAVSRSAASQRVGAGRPIRAVDRIAVGSRSAAEPIWNHPIAETAIAGGICRWPMRKIRWIAKYCVVVIQKTDMRRTKRRYRRHIVVIKSTGPTCLPGRRVASIVGVEVRKL